MSGRSFDHSCRPAETAAPKRPRKHIGYVRVPTSVVLTPRVLSEAMRKLSIKAIHHAVEVLIEELNYRYGDPDFELEPIEDTE